MKHRIHAFLAAMLLLLPELAMAQQVAPIPHPRISRPGPLLQQSTPADTDQQGQNETQGQAADGLQTPPTPEQTLSPPSSAPATAQPISLSARIAENGAIIPGGLVWRVFDTKTDESGQLALLFKSEEATASLELPPGEYLVHVSYGRAQSSDTLQVQTGPNIKSLVLDAGALRLRSAITTELNIPPNQLKFNIFANGLDGEQIPVVQGVTQDEMVYLNAGIYKVVSRWGEQNAIVRADIRVEPGQVTEATLFHKAARVNFSLVSSAGGEAIADVDWKVLDKDGEVIFTHLGAFPTAVLAEGEYSVIAKSGEAVYNRPFQVQAGRPIDVEVLTTVY